jgi:hypothetical protein
MEQIMRDLMRYCEPLPIDVFMLVDADDEPRRRVSARTNFTGDSAWEVCRSHFEAKRVDDVLEANRGIPECVLE